MERIVAITGVGSGIGLALAQRFVQDGARVAGCDLVPDAAAGVCDPLVRADVTDPDAMRAFADAALARHGRVDALIANAGAAKRIGFEEATAEDIEHVVRVNLFGVMHAVRAVLPAMRAQGHGRIVVVGSRNAELCPPRLVGYSVSKAGVAVFVRTLSRELDGTGILINMLIPGPTRSGMNPRGTQEPDECYPTARMLATLPDGGSSGRTFFREREYPFFQLFVDGVERV